MGTDLSNYDSARLALVAAQVGPEDNPATRRNLISAADAVAIADLPDAQKAAAMTTLGPDQQKIVETVAGVRRTSLGREMTDTAAKKDVWMIVDNNIKGGGYYKSDLNLIAFELKDDGSGDKNSVYDRSTAKGWNSGAQSVTRETAYHELTHFYQDKVYNTLTPPADIRPVDQQLWRLGTEAQAVMTAREGILQERSLKSSDGVDGQREFSDPEFLRYSFVDQMRNDDFHKSYYDLAATNGSQGRALTTQEFANAFGKIPGQDKNFLAGTFDSVDDVYATVLKPEDASPDVMRNAFAKAAHPVNFDSAAELQAEDGKNGARLVMSQDKAHAMILSEANGALTTKEFEKTELANGQTGYRLSSYDVMSLDDPNALVTMPVPNWTKGVNPAAGFDAVYARTVDGKLQTAMTHYSAFEQREHMLSGSADVIGTQSLSGKLVGQDGWLESQRAKTVVLTGVFGSQAANTTPAPPKVQPVNLGTPPAPPEPARVATPVFLGTGGPG